MINKEPLTVPPGKDFTQDVHPLTTNSPMIPLVQQRTTNVRNGHNRNHVKEQTKNATIIIEQLREDEQQGIIVIQPTLKNVITYHAPNPKRGPSNLPLITQYFPDNNILEPLFSCNPYDEYGMTEKEVNLP